MFRVFSRGVGYFCVLLAAAFWGSEGVIVKLCYNVGYNTASILFFRFLIGTLVFNTAAIILKQERKIPRENWLSFSFLALFQMLAALCLFKAFQFLTPALAIMFFYFYPPLTCLIGIVFFKEEIIWTKIISLIGAFSGLLLLYGSSFGNISAKGIGFALLAAVLQAIYYTFIAKLLKKVSTTAYNCNVNIVSLIIYAVYMLFSKSLVFIPTPGGIGFITLLGIVAWVMPSYFLTKGIRQIGSTDSTIILFLETPFTVLISYLVFREILEPLQFLGAFLIIGSVALPQIWNFYLNRRKIKTEHEEENKS